MRNSLCVFMSKVALLNQLSFLKGISSKNVLPICQFFLLNAGHFSRDTVQLVATDMEVTLSGLAATQEIVTHGSALIPLQKFSSLVAEFPDKPIKISYDERVTVSCDNSKFVFRSPPPSEFVEYRKPDKFTYAISAKKFNTMLNRVIFAHSSEESRFSLNGAQLLLTPTTIQLEATNGHHLARVKYSDMEFYSSTNEKLLIPLKTLKFLAKMTEKAEEDEDIMLKVDENSVSFRTWDQTITTPQLAGQFPPLDKVIPIQNDLFGVVNVSEFQSALVRAMFFADDLTQAVDLNLSQNQIQLSVPSAKDSSEVEEIIQFQYEGIPVKIRCNGSYLLKFLNCCQTEKLKIGFRDPNTALLITPENEPDSEYQYVLMPMRN